MRHDPSGLRANTTAVVWPAVECWIQQRSSRSMSCARSSASSPSDRRFTCRDRGIGASPVSSSSSMPRSGGKPGGFHLERRKRRIVGSREAQFRVGQAKGCQVELCAVLEHLHAIDEAGGTVRLRREARPPPSTSRLPLRAFEGSKVGVIGVERAGPARRATWRRLRGRRGGGRDSRSGPTRSILRRSR